MNNRPEIKRNEPSFFRFPIQNNRTAWKPYSIPLILIEPRRRDINGLNVINSGVTELRYYIADAPNQAKVAGPFNTNILVPIIERFSITVDPILQYSKKIGINGLNIYDENNNLVNREPEEGDFFEYFLENGNVRDIIPYFPDANYYDLSNISIETEDLPYPERYLFIWEAKYYERISTSSNELVCITNDIISSTFKLDVNHPGEVHHLMYQGTPDINLESSNLSENTTLDIYRPFADALQDIFDESTLLEGINWIDNIPAQLIPYLAFLIGWDLPNHPGVSDNIRRSILRNGVKLQKLKGTKRVIKEFFDILGFSVDIINLWISLDGKRYIGPNETLPEQYKSQEIITQNKCQSEPLLSRYETSGFGQLEIPLLRIPTNKIAIDAWLVKKNSTANESLRNISENISEDINLYTNVMCPKDQDGFIIPNDLLSNLESNEDDIISISQILIDNGKAIKEIQVGSEKILNTTGVSHNINKNIINITFDHYIDFKDTDNEEVQLFVFATYEYKEIIIPKELKNLRSNKFDIEILNKFNEESPNQNILEFLINYLFNLKAFHSLLRRIIFTIQLYDIYNVQDFCLGGQIEQDIGTTAGELQTPPPILPVESTECDKDIITRGVKQKDLDLRQLIINGLKAENEAWKLFDGRNYNPLIESISNVNANKPDGNECQYTIYGQNRIIQDDTIDPDHDDQEPLKLCDNTNVDNCFQGRLKDNLNFSIDISKNEHYRCVPCRLKLGDGVYWSYNNKLDNYINNQEKSRFLGNELKNYSNFTRSLHYSNRNYIKSDFGIKDRYLGIERKNINIELDNLGFPGHRYPRLSNLKNDFNHEIWKAKPWDDNYSKITCDKNLLNLNLLNAELIIEDDGNERLIFDVADLEYSGNNIEPDISSLGSHDNKSYIVTHKLYSNTNEGPLSDNGQSIVTLEGISITPLDTIDFDTVNQYDPYYTSYNLSCNKDYIDGYPSDFDEYDLSSIEDFTFDRSDTYNSIYSDILNLPEFNISEYDTLLFKLNSQIKLNDEEYDYRYHIPYRLDCGCNDYDCGELTSGLDSNVHYLCESELFKNQDNNFIPDCDKIDIERTMISNEYINVNTLRLNGDIPNLLCQLIDNLLPDNEFIRFNDNIKYKDDYGIIYEIAWNYDGEILDITTISKSPRIWGEDPQGYVNGLKVFRKGTITTIRQLILINNNTVIGEFKDQTIDYYQDNVLCGDRKFENNFCYDINNGMLDNVEFIITCGPAWSKAPEEPIKELNFPFTPKQDPLETNKIDGDPTVVICEDDVYWDEIS